MSESPVGKYWPRLSADLVGPRTPDRCQSCGGHEDLDRWREHDDQDRPEPIIVVLCEGCSRRLIEKHPRLYGKLGANDPAPGSMAICIDCRSRDGTGCTHPSAKANGGEGVILRIRRPIDLHVCRSPRRSSGWTRIWPMAVKGCEQKQARDQLPEVAR